MKRVEVKTRDGVVSLTDRVELFYEDRITQFGNGTKVAPRKYIGRRVFVIVWGEERRR